MNDLYLLHRQVIYLLRVSERSSDSYIGRDDFLNFFQAKSRNKVRLKFTLSLFEI